MAVIGTFEILWFGIEGVEGCNSESGGWLELGGVGWYLRSLETRRCRGCEGCLSIAESCLFWRGVLCKMDIL